MLEIFQQGSTLCQVLGCPCNEAAKRRLEAGQHDEQPIMIRSKLCTGCIAQSAESLEGHWDMVAEDYPGKSSFAKS